MDDMLVIELPSHREAIGLRAELEGERLCFVEFHDEVWSVRAGFGPDPADFGRLLRWLEHWVAAWELGAVRIQLDGRAYVVAAGASELDAPAFDLTRR